MYKFIKSLSNVDPSFSLGAFLYQDMTTNKYYISYTHYDSENIIDNSNQYMLLDNKPKITKQPFLKNIKIIAEVTPYDFMVKRIKDYKLE